jgi:hypothetical protein
LDAQDAAKKLSPGQSGNKTGCHIPLSTAAHMSARFTFVSPAGRFRDGSHIVDGGYFENSAATAAYEIATRIKERCSLPKHEITNVDVKVIMISNDPRKPPIDPAAPPPKPTQPKRTKKMTVSGNFLGDVTAPIYSLLNTRDARGTYAQKAIMLEQRPVNANEATPVVEGQPAGPGPKHIFYFRLRDTQVPLPLGWMLSDAAAQTMQQQLDLDDDVVSNKTAITEVISYLPPSVKP